MKSIKVFQESPDDSETLPALLTVTDSRTLMNNLMELIGELNSENKTLVMVLNKTRILSTDLISNSASYDLSFKVKEKIIKLYLDSINV